MNPSNGQKKAILFVLSQGAPPCMPAVKEAVARSQGLDLIEASSIAEAQMIVTDSWCGIIVLVADKRDDLAAVITFLNGNIERIKTAKTIRVLVFNKIPHPKVTSLLRTQGSAEVLEFGVTAKAFMHKIQQHLKLLHLPGAEEKSARRMERGMRADAEGDGSPQSKIQELPALTHACDFWIIEGKADAKKIMGRWLVTAIGPGPSAGDWMQIPVKSGAAKGSLAWQWKTKSSESPFATPEGRWVFFGRQPEFNWRVNRWRFVGDRPSMIYYEGDQVIATRFIAESADLIQVARLSSQAQKKLPLIEATFAGEATAAKKEVSENDDSVTRIGGDESDESETKRRARGQSEKSQETDPGSTLVEGLKDDSEKTSGKDARFAAELEAESKDGIFTSESEQQKKDGRFDLEPEPEKKDGPFASEREPDQEDKPFSSEKEPEVTNWRDRQSQDSRKQGSAADINIELVPQVFDDTRVEVEADYSTGEDAFQAIGLLVLVNGTSAQILEHLGKRLTLAVADIGLEPGQSVNLSVMTKNLGPMTMVESKCEVVDVKAREPGADSTIEIIMGSESEVGWSKVGKAIEQRQQEILEFMKLVKGA